MSEQIFSKKLALCLGVLAVIFSISYLALAWQDPTGTPPNNNTALPINVSTVSQAKLGSFGVGGVFSAYGGNSTTTMVVAGKYVGIGISTTTPGISGGSTPSFPLEIQSNDTNFTTPLLLRGMYQGARYGAAGITPSVDGVYLSYGVYTKDALWKNDPYIQQYTGVPNTSGAKLSVTKDGGAHWNAYSAAGLTGNTVTTWNVAADLTLWNASGTWVGKALPQIASSTVQSLCTNATHVGKIEYWINAGVGHFEGCTYNGTSYGWRQLDN